MLGDTVRGKLVEMDGIRPSMWKSYGLDFA